MEIENVGEDTYTLMARGHHDAHDFMRAVAASFYSEWPMGDPWQTWWHATPMKGGSRYSESKESTRGSFPVTVSMEAHGECKYQAPAPG